MNLQALKTELAEEKYGGLSDEAAARLCNVSDQQVDRDSITGGEIAASVVRSELAALDPADQQYVRILIGAGEMPLTTNLRSELADMFPAQSGTRVNFRRILKRTGSRAEQIGLGRVTPSDVAKARKIP